MVEHKTIARSEGKAQRERLQLLNKLAIRQLDAIEEIGTSEIKKLKGK